MSKKAKWNCNPSGAKLPRVKETPSDGKFVRIEEDPESTDRKNIVWHVKLIDHEGPWGWCNTVGKRKLAWYIHDKMANFETMTWATIKSSRDNHSCLVADISRDAQKRLREINLDQYDELFSLRFSGKIRVWGIRDQRVFKILWWDPNHTVYPSMKKHT